MNRFAIAGHLGQNPESGDKDGKPWTRLRVAVNRRKDEADWFDVVAFGKLAENTSTLHTGDGVAIEGRLEIRHSEGYGAQVKLKAHTVKFFRRTPAEAS
jgi:single-stranded DNA-binding protein